MTLIKENGNIVLSRHLNLCHDIKTECRNTFEDYRDIVRAKELMYVATFQTYVATLIEEKHLEENCRMSQHFRRLLRHCYSKRFNVCRNIPNLCRDIKQGWRLRNSIVTHKFHVSTQLRAVRRKLCRHKAFYVTTYHSSVNIARHERNVVT